MLSLAKNVLGAEEGFFKELNISKTMVFGFFSLIMTGFCRSSCSIFTCKGDSCKHAHC